MTKTLHLIRHAKTEKISQEGTDISRKLTFKGVVQANVVAEALYQKNFNTDITLVSSAMRTKETAQILGNRLSLGQVSFFNDLYLASFQEIIKLIGLQEGASSITIIGHNDGLSECASYLTGEEIYLKPSDHIKIVFYTENWKEISKHSGQIIDQNRPCIHLLQDESDK